MFHTNITKEEANKEISQRKNEGREKAMKLSENEKRDAVKLIQEGKQLPEKYRFLLFDDDREVELVWNGKTQEVCNLVLPFQTIEHIDEPRSERISKDTQINLFDTSGRQIRGWTNKLIWGDNKLILSSLKNGPMRREIEKQGGLKLIYIDPPFDVGADFSMNVEIGDESFTKKPSVIEEVAYRDTWGKGADSFIAMIYERLKLMHGLLADDGSIYVHCDSRVNSYVRLVLDEIFGKSNFINQISWQRVYSHNDSIRYGKVHDTILFYSKGDKYIFNKVFEEYSEKYLKMYSMDDGDGRKYKVENTLGPGGRGSKYDWNGHNRIWRYSLEAMKKLEADRLLYYTNTGFPKKKVYLNEMPGKPLQDMWMDINVIAGQGQRNWLDILLKSRKPY